MQRLCSVTIGHQSLQQLLQRNNNAHPSASSGDQPDKDFSILGFRLYALLVAQRGNTTRWKKAKKKDELQLTECTALPKSLAKHTSTRTNNKCESCRDLSIYRVWVLLLLLTWVFLFFMTICCFLSPVWAFSLQVRLAEPLTNKDLVQLAWWERKK